MNLFIFLDHILKKGTGGVIHYAHEHLLTPTWPLQMRNEAGGLLRPKIKDKTTMSLTQTNDISLSMLLMFCYI